MLRGLLLLWLLLLALVILLPVVTASASLGDDLIRHTIRLSLLYYAVAAVVMLRLRPEDWPASGGMRVARLCWTLAWVTYLIHLAMAFHFYHDWSHEDAVRHTREVSGVGEGIYVSHVFTLAWSADVLFWWLDPEAYARRSPWIGRLLHGFMLFIIFCGTVVYEKGVIQWAGGLLTLLLAVLWLLSHWRRGQPCDQPA